MTSPTRAAVVSFVAGVLLIAGNAAHAQPTSTTVPSPNEPGRNIVSGADASDPSHVWAVGTILTQPSTTTTSYRSLLLRFDGTAWRAAPRTGFPGNDGLADVDSPAGNVAWAVGSYRSGYATSTLVASWDGSTWTAQRTPNGNPGSANQLSGVAAVPNSAMVWAVGSYADGRSPIGHSSLILQRASGTWRLVPAPRVASADFLEAVDATGPADAWAVGWGSNHIYLAPTTPIVLRWNGASWQSVRLPAPAATVLYGVKALAPDNVWVVGQTTIATAPWRVPFTAHFNGVSWRQVPTPTIGDGRLNDVVALAPSNLYAVGSAGDESSGNRTTLVLRWNGSSWMRVPTPSPQYNPTFTGAAVVGPSTVWAVGHRTDQSRPLYEERTLTVQTTNG